MFTKEDNKICNKNIHINSPKHTKDKKAFGVFQRLLRLQRKNDKYKFIEDLETPSQTLQAFEKA